MTPNAALLLPARPLSGAPAVDRRHSPGAFRGSLERRLPASTQMVEAECLLPPVGRSEAFAEDLFDEPGAGAVPIAHMAPTGRRGPRLRWLGLPMLALGVGATLSLVSVSGMAGLVGF